MIISILNATKQILTNGLPLTNPKFLMGSNSFTCTTGTSVWEISSNKHVCDIFTYCIAVMHKEFISNIQTMNKRSNEFKESQSKKPKA